jgi:hypothetical protein
MQIKQAEIWYNYVTYFEGPPITIETIALILLKSSITRCVFSTHGIYYFLQDNIMHTRKMKMNINPNQTKASFNIKEWPDDNFSKEILYQNYINYFYEFRIFSFDTSHIDHKYLRFSLDEMIIENDENRLHIFPFVVLYSSGVMIIEFRIIFDYDISSSDFINKYINLSTREYNKCYSNNALATYAQKINGETDRLEKYTDGLNDFPFELNEFKIPYEKQKTLTNTAMLIVKIFETILNEPLLKTRKKITRFSFGRYWFFKPHIHLLDFEHQQKKASNNNKKHEVFINQVLTRIPFGKEDIKDVGKLIDLRRFEDYSTFFNIAASLNIWSKDGIQHEKENTDLNYNNYIYQNQVINRFLDYYRMLYQSSIFIMNSAEDYEIILEYQKSLFLLENDYNFLTKSGELYDVLTFVRKEDNIEFQENIINSFLEIKRMQSESKKNKFINSISIFIKIFFGIISSGSLSRDLIFPFWKIIGLPVSKNQYINNVAFWIITFVILMIIIFIVSKKMNKKTG